MMADVGSAQTRWERQESRVVRPFKSAEEYLSDSRLRLYADGDFVDDPIIQIENIQTDRLALAVKIPAPSGEFSDAVGVELRDLALLVSIEDRTFKNSWILHREKLSEFTGGVVDLKGIDERMSWASDTRLHISVVLSKTRNASVGLASRAGSWLAKKTFFIKRPTDTSTFRITSVTEEYFRTRGLPPKTTYFVDIQDPDLNQPCENMPNLINVCMHETAYAALAKDDASIVAKALIRNIYVDVVSTILTAGCNSLNGEVQTNSILDVVSRRLMKATGVSLEKLKQFAVDSGGAPLRAVIQAEADLTRIVVAAMSRRVQ